MVPNLVGCRITLCVHRPQKYICLRSQDEVPGKPLLFNTPWKHAARAVYAILLRRGDIARFRVEFGASNARSAARDIAEHSPKSKYSDAYQFYEQAHSVYPFGGKLHHRIASLDLIRGDFFMAAYHCVRALGSVDRDESAHGTFLSVLNSNRERLGHLMASHSFSRVEGLPSQYFFAGEFNPNPMSNDRGRGYSVQSPPIVVSKEIAMFNADRLLLILKTLVVSVVDMAVKRSGKEEAHKILRRISGSSNRLLQSSVLKPIEITRMIVLLLGGQ